MLDRLDHVLDGAPPWAPPLVFLVGVLMLLGGGHWLVEGAVRLARRFGVSTLLIGLTIVAFGTSAPELALNLSAAFHGNTDLSFGNVVGSNIANIGLVLGVAALVRPLDVHSRVLGREIPLLVGVSVILVAFAALSYGGEAAGFSRIEGVVMLTAFAGVSAAWFGLAKSDRADPLVMEMLVEAQEQPVGSLSGACGLFGFGLLALVFGGQLTETGAIAVAERMGWSEALIGVTIVAIATSLPEAITSVVACVRGHTDLAVGNVVGSNLFNILLVLGASCTVTPVAVPTDAAWGGLALGWWDLIVMLGFTAALVPIGFTGGRRITRPEGAVLLGGYAAYLAFRAATS